MKSPSRRLASTAPPPLRGRVSFALVCSMVIAVTMAALLALNIAVARSSYAQDDLTARLGLLTEQQQALREELELREAPSALEARAASLGMIPANRAFLSLKDGALMGDTSPAQPPPPEEEDGSDTGSSAAAPDDADAPPTTTGDAP